ncbi:MAG: hypothetical protein PHS45_01060 [Bacilli bacterium]|nr:hypothetical protein [Bacilli bacterium]
MNKTITGIIGMIGIILLIMGIIFLRPTNMDNKTIVIWAYDTMADAAKKAVEIYKAENENIDYDFEVVQLGQEDMVEKIKVYLNTGSLNNLPDIFYDEDYNFMEYIKYYGENFVDLTDSINPNDYSDFKIINVTFNDRIYAIPYDCGVGVLFYRTDLIKKAGYTDEDMQNLTWDEYIEIGKKVKQATGIDMIVIIPEGDMEGRLMYQSAGTWFFDEDGNANIANNDGFKDAYKTMKKVFDANIVYKATSWDDMIGAISNEKIASLIGGSWWAPIIQDYEEQKELWKIAVMPRMAGSATYTNFSNLGGGNWFILNKKNKDIALDFAVKTFGQSTELANYMAQTAGVVPVNKNSANNLNESGNPFFGGQKITTIMAGYAKNINPVKYGLHTYEITYTVGTIAGEYINNKLTLEEAIAKMQTETEKVVKAD